MHARLTTLLLTCKADNFNLPKLQVDFCFFVPVNNFQSKINSNGKLIVW